MDLKTLNQENQDTWNQNAVFWDERMGEGNQFQKVLVGPTTERLLDLKQGELVLEIACGNGVFARRMAQLGAQVIASDFSETFLERARERSKEFSGRIEYRLIDATDEEQLLVLGKRRFDAVVCSMAMMDMVTIEPMLAALSKLLKTNGRFVFSLMHPCFNNASVRLTMEEEDRNGELVTVYSVRVPKYITAFTQKGLGMIDQPVPHYYFHRPLSVLFNACFQAGFVINGLEEPAFDESESGNRPLSWVNFKDIPPVLVVRCILASS